MDCRKLWVPVAIALFAAGCATQHPTMARSLTDTATTQPTIITEIQLSKISADSPPASEVASQSLIIEKLTLTKALALALQHNPTLAGFAEEIRARDAAALQAGLSPNPNLGVEIANFAGQNDLRGFDGAETTIALSQLIELGDKRTKRRHVAVLEKDLAAWDYQSTKLDVLAATAKAFIQVLVAQEQVSLNDELVKLAEKTAAAVGERVDAGKVSPLENTRTQVELAAAQSEANKTSRELEVARRRLAAFWGADRSEFVEVVGDLTTITPLPPETMLQTFLARNPDLNRWESELDRNKSALALARSEAVSDLSISAGVRNFRESNTSALVVGIDLPLPLFNRNQGGIGEAQANVEKARHEQRAAKVALQTELSEMWQNLAASYVESSTLHDKILPGALEAFEATDFGYREGKLDFLQMLDAQRTLFTVKRQYLLALGNYHITRSNVERLIGAPIKSLQNPTITKNN
ncbi:MAG: TolC family protein [Proteobacteria bacterium]|nr:TolC family protein [Desulfobulbaceae bacterium]MBU4153000.1 TolC family protein [Pseudomonadota bacterium]